MCNPCTFLLRCILKRVKITILFVCAVAVAAGVIVANMTDDCKLAENITILAYAQLAWFFVSFCCLDCFMISFLSILTAIANFILSIVFIVLLFNYDVGTTCHLESIDISHCIRAIGFAEGVVVAINLIVLFEEIQDVKPNSSYDNLK
tara:strand:+ start:627 stop:1070 length:444 start_codon:yes stop_codon:yes gene_type:complete